MPASPHSAAGPRIEPPVSVPMPPRMRPAATPAPVPLLLPAVKCSVFHGLRAGGFGRSKEGPPSANSWVVVLPIRTVPAAASFSAQAASVSGMLSCRIFEPQVVGMPLVSTMSLRPIGMPCSGPFGPPAMIALSASRASASARSSVKWTKACRRSSRARTRSRQARASRKSSVWSEISAGMVSLRCCDGAYFKTDRKRRASPPERRGLFHGDLAGHAGPVVIRADQLKVPGLPRDEIKVLCLAGAQDELGLVGVEDGRIIDLGGLEQIGRVEFVHLLAAVLDMQPVGNAPPEGQFVRRELRLARDDGDLFGLWPVGRLSDGRCGDRNQEQGNRRPGTQQEA